MRRTVSGFTEGAVNMTEEEQPEPTTQEITEEDRTTSLGLFNFAEAFWRAAQVLAEAKIKGGHARTPVSFRYYHSD